MNHQSAGQHLTTEVDFLQDGLQLFGAANSPCVSQYYDSFEPSSTSKQSVNVSIAF